MRHETNNKSLLLIAKVLVFFLIGDLEPLDLQIGLESRHQRCLKSPSHRSRASEHSHGWPLGGYQRPLCSRTLDCWRPSRRRHPFCFDAIVGVACQLDRGHDGHGLQVQIYGRELNPEALGVGVGVGFGFGFRFRLTHSTAKSPRLTQNPLSISLLLFKNKKHSKSFFFHLCVTTSKDYVAYQRVSSYSTTSVHMTVLDGLVNVKSLFTIAVFLGLSLVTLRQQSLENRGCDAGIDVGTWPRSCWSSRSSPPAS